MKDTFYFNHDCMAQQDDKIRKLIRKHGYEGYGIFWSIIESLYLNANALRTDYEGIAYDMRVNESTIQSIINDFDLFTIKDGFFGSKSVERRLNERYEKSNKAKKSAQSRWNNKASDANALNKECERIEKSCDSNAINEIKLKEIKVNNNIYTHENVEQSSTCESEKKEKGKEINYQGLIDMFNKEFEGLLPKVVKLTDSRKKAIKNRIAENSKEDVIKVFNNVKSSDFLLGKEKDWACNFDWIFNSSNFVKILEGNYNKNNDVKSNCYD